MNPKACLTAAWWARSMAAATAGSETAHKVDTDFHRGERQVIASNRLRSWARVSCNLSSQFPGIRRLPAMLSEEEVTSHLGPHSRPISSRHRGAHRQAGCRIDCRDAFRHLELERADVAIIDPERSSKADTWKSRAERSGPSSWCCRSSANGCRYRSRTALSICSAVTGSPAASPSIPSDWTLRVRGGTSDGSAAV